MRKAAWLAIAMPILVGAVPAPDPFAEFAVICTNTKLLWGESACGPIMLVDPASRRVTTNAPDPAGVLTKQGTTWAGTLPASVPVANTASEWGGVRWTMLRLPMPGDPEARRVLMIHEAFHRIQPVLGFTGRETDNGHLDTEAGRVWLRLEMRALDRALAGGRDWRTAARNALAFRAERRRLAGDGTAAAEDALERNEGLAEYTGIKVGAGNRATAVARVRLGEIAERPSYVRAFAYATGPAYGQLLDRTGGAWRQAVRGQAATLSALLASRVGAASSPAAADRYGAGVIRSEEAARAARIAERNRDYRARLVDGLVLRIGFVTMNIEFDPNRVFALNGEGAVYPTLTVRDAWGTLTVTGDALLASDWSNVRVAGRAVQQGERLSGPGWALDLKPGWTIEDAGREQRLVKRP